MGYWLAYTLILVVGLTLGIGTLIGMRRYRKSSSFLRQLVENITLTLLAIFLTFMAAEFFFKEFFAQTDSFDFTLASRNWFEHYWITNSMGYRDIEWSQADVQGKRKILVVGDSFAAGFGIENVEDRFSNVLGHKLGSDYVVMNMASPGISTQQEIERIGGFPYKPDIVIWQYYINDIRQAAERKNAIFNLPKKDPWPIFQPLVNNSYALNFIYWRAVRLGPQTWEGAYLPWLKGTFNDPDIWWLHQQELLTIVEGAASEKVKLIVVVFPALSNVKESKEITLKVLTLFEERGVPVLDVAKLVEDVPPEQLVVNPLDAHPNEWVHQQVADKLYELVAQLE